MLIFRNKLYYAPGSFSGPSEAWHPQKEVEVFVCPFFLTGEMTLHVIELFLFKLFL